MNIIQPRSGVSFVLKKNELLKITDIFGEQVSDLICYNYHDKAEYLSSGRSPRESAIGAGSFPVLARCGPTGGAGRP